MENPSDPVSEQIARRANSFGARAADYAEHRPDYPAEAVGWVVETVADRHPPTVLDLGAGTGKLTHGLLAAGAHVIAVEPDEQMRAELAHRCPGVTVHAGTAEMIPLGNDSVDAVVAGQAFHWFDQQRAFPEIARVLRRDGTFAALWNIDDQSVGWVAGLHAVAETTMSMPLLRWLDAGLPTHPLFHEFERANFPHKHRRTAESLTATIGTHSHTMVISAEERTEVLDRITAYLRAQPETATGDFDVPIVTVALRSTPRAT
ncbi:class I SAM-dependent methyltransferase [Nocardia sp. 004]|uniref:class I SAM-dependent methyltransferase n=1 Tax=Nocardia sp. 004 TaxID=3385978 RepID=UPI00399FDD6E